MTDSTLFTIIVEGYTHSEGTSFDRLRASLEAAKQMMHEQGQGEILFLDIQGSQAVQNLLEDSFPEVIPIDARGLSYDQAKTLAAHSAKGKYICYLDGDCLPVEKTWLTYHLNTLKRDDLVATGGFTRYDGGYWAALQSIMDFGFLYPVGKRILQCYAFNNSGFERQWMIDIPVPDGEMRCRCYAHAQSFIKKNHPMMMVPEARVLHELPPFFSERFRQGYDAVAACWINPDLPETRLLWLGVLAAPLFYLRNVLFDWRRIFQGYQDLNLNLWQAILSLPVFPICRLVDLMGIVSALIGQKQIYDKPY
jgi:hypothetical protein